VKSVPLTDGKGWVRRKEVCVWGRARKEELWSSRLAEGGGAAEEARTGEVKNCSLF
jgi:hypothetical protein